MDLQFYFLVIKKQIQQRNEMETLGGEHVALLIDCGRNKLKAGTKLEGCLSQITQFYSAIFPAIVLRGLSFSCKVTGLYVGPSLMCILTRGGNSLQSYNLKGSHTNREIGEQFNLALVLPSSADGR